MAKALKRMLADELEAALGDAPSLLLIDPGPMPVETNQAFRHDLREKAGGAQMRVIHNRTARVALGRITEDGDDLDVILTGPSAVLYGGEGAVPIAKVVRDFRRRFKEIKVKGAIADGEVLPAAEAEGLADLPGLEDLRGMLAGAIIGSARGLAAGLQAVYGGIARAMQARIDEQGGAEAETTGDDGGEQASD